MNFEYFLAHRIAFSKFPSFAKWIIRIATAAVAMSLAIMIITTSVITGFKNQITEKIFGFWGHIHIMDTSINRTFEPKAIQANQDYLLKLKDLEEVSYKKISYDFDDSMDPMEENFLLKSKIDHIQAFAITPGIIKTGQDLEGILLKGVDADFDTLTIHKFLEEGRAIHFSDSLASRDLIISTETARRLNIYLGESIRIYFVKERDQLVRRFNVTGIYKTGLEEYDKKFALVDMRMVQDVLGWTEDQVGGYEIYLDNMEDMDLFNEYIYMEVLPPNLYSETIRTKFPSIFEWLELQNINEDVILLLMIIVSIINMVTALLILILERTHMIGTLKSLGSTNWSIRKIFLYHAGYIIGRGMLIGNAIALIICFLQWKFGFIKLDEKSYYLSTAPIELQFNSWLIINVLTFLFTLSFLILPTYVITKIDPIKALRFD